MTGSGPHPALASALEHLGDPRGDGELSDDALVQATLTRLDDGERGDLVDGDEPVAPRRRGLAMALAVAAAVVVVGGTAWVMVDRQTGSLEGTEPLKNEAAMEAVRPGETGAAVPRKPAPVQRPEGPALPPAEAIVPEPPPVPEVEPELQRPEPRRPSRKTASADDLLGAAQSLLARSKTREAIAVYETVLDRHPSTPEAEQALMSLGRLALGRGEPRAALRYFDRYIHRKGDLVIEARYERIRALRAMGALEREREAIAEFLTLHGDSGFARAVRLGAEDLDDPGK